MATQVFDYRVVVDEKHLRAETFFPGIAYVEFNRTGCLSIWNICKMFEAGRIIPFFEANFLDNKTLRSDKSTFFLLGGDYYFDSCLWEITQKYHHFPYKVSAELINIGQTSISIRQALTNMLDGKEIATFYGKYVYVDKTSKKSQSFPGWYRIKYGSVESSHNIQFESSNSLVPENVFKVEFVIAPSDTDFNSHTNQGSYVRFCLDAAEIVRQAQNLKDFTTDVCLYPVVKLSTSYKGETSAGDKVSMSVWQDHKAPSVLNFALHKGDKLAFTACLTFKTPFNCRL